VSSRSDWRSALRRSILSGMSRSRKNRLLGDEPLTSARLEAFSDGVIAIILTIMVLELKVPATAEPRDLLHSWPLFISYVLSFFFVSVYWVNHHHLFHRVRQVDLPILWANVGLLFFLSLVPFFTEWMESTRLSPFPTAIYAASLLVCGVAFFVLDVAVGRQNMTEAELVTLRRAAHRKNAIAILIYVVAMPLAFYRPILSLALVFLVALLYAIPSLWVEHYAEHLEKRQAEHARGGTTPEPYIGPSAGNE
jgi:uncharacterized membrane protein